MKLVAFRTSSSFHIGALVGQEQVLDLNHNACGLPPAVGNDAYDLDGAFLPAAAKLVASLSDAAVQNRVRAALLPRTQVQLHAPVVRPGKLLCIGLNYRDHAEEQGVKLPSRPLIFSKFATAVQAPGGTIKIPHSSKETDYEAELGVVIGRRASSVARDRAMAHVLGYCNFHDVSARDYQFADGQWVRGKSCDTFAPFGEFIATTDEIPNPHALGIRLRLNGQTMQNSSTSQLVFDIPALIEAISADITLEPGDVIATGTPPGVGFARKPPVYLKPGDVVEVEIDGLGVLRNPVG